MQQAQHVLAKAGMGKLFEGGHVKREDARRAVSKLKEAGVLGEHAGLKFQKEEARVLRVRDTISTQRKEDRMAEFKQEVAAEENAVSAVTRPAAVASIAQLGGGVKRGASIIQTAGAATSSISSVSAAGKPKATASIKQTKPSIMLKDIPF
ncbi:MAG: hypothetical protein HW383_636 [Candidatus Magasanikbacteria bacterium]|nr:hypothetical protein [Candidatus Magasanikbacteria bacterium]